MKHCYEELILIEPGNPNFIARYAEILYTIGGLANYQTALKYISAIIVEHDYDLRANLTCL